MDLSQIEVGIAAGLFRDAALVADFNAGDVYAAMAQRIFAGQIPPEDANLGWREFKAKYPQLRDRTKPLVLGIIYGKTVYGIALDLGSAAGRRSDSGTAFDSSIRRCAMGWTGLALARSAGATPTSRDSVGSARAAGRPPRTRSGAWATPTSRARPHLSSSTPAIGCGSSTAGTGPG